MCALAGAPDGPNAPAGAALVGAAPLRHRPASARRAQSEKAHYDSSDDELEENAHEAGGKRKAAGAHGVDDYFAGFEDVKQCSLNDKELLSVRFGWTMCTSGMLAPRSRLQWQHFCDSLGHRVAARPSSCAQLQVLPAWLR
jgi:hypothetical protein